MIGFCVVCLLGEFIFHRQNIFWFINFVDIEY